MVQLLYLACAAAFVIGLKRLSSPRTARSGNIVAGLGMLAAVVITLLHQDILNWGAIAVAAAVGAAVGVVWARQVAMTAMPQMVAALNGFGGAASALVAGAELAARDPGATRLDIQVTILLALAIGAVTFSGSVIAFGKLQGLVSGSAIAYRAQAAVSVLVTLVAVGAAVAALATGEVFGFWVVGGVALVIGVLMVLPVGGADMPVVVSLLNSFSGLAAAGTGFAIENSALIIGGALVGSAGFILTVQMCEAMNRSLMNVLLGAFTSAQAATATAEAGDTSVRAATAEDVAIALAYAERVLIVPGYGLAVAQAQHDVQKLARELEARGVEVGYAIHPVAGRMPGHMNVLLAEADVAYEKLLDMDDANQIAARTDVMLVLGANDVVNPAARDDPSSPIYGMPIIEVDRAKTVVVVKRSLAPGYAGIDNPLFYFDQTMMFFGDAKEALQRVTESLSLV
ncbi:MAG TPA: NAD(P)(+) transhydrogenase (Re/Si-specific) subunit beta [Egibacteraceae bacterium]|nr:NAD(P)(+) transhydrogenase (Re/Si-specific) subunit beta [Egibacteraceae bacterium]